MKPFIERVLWAVLLVTLVLAYLERGGGIIAPSKVTAAVYVHEKSETPITAAVSAAINTLNRQGIVATLFDADTTDGSGETPAQYQVPLAAAKEVGLPALVVMSGETVVRTVKAPRTMEDILEAVQ
jgi:hypothetical protein